MNILPVMRTAEYIIEKLGKNAKMAERFGVLPSAVSNWKSDNCFPSRLHMAIYLALKDAGEEIEPDEIPVSPTEPRNQRQQRASA